MLKRKGKRLAFSIVFLTLGFLLSFSYSITKDQFSQDGQGHAAVSQYSAQEKQVRKELLQIQQRNLELQDHLYKNQDIIREFEQKLSDENDLSSLTEQAERYRLILGKVAVEGPGVEVTLKDGQYDPAILNINDYIVHEHHIFNVMNELYIAGAEAISINGQRISHDSYIVCNGPVITIDDVQYPAPFVISAIGDGEVLAAALNITGGIKDQLVNDHIIFTLEKKALLTMDPIIGGL
ncbi:DUF881 domain-containing protein [Jeotgalibacillus sp. S-D1]|uniref:DUF881 domain-containing protein n=1 Tax=Jeotgalibacillus sp. S-D1 TaxID=2552189 RepID=UPI001F0E1221|nr:DUF881 domain-containing protein [Jeotgalibacillus sp. S-D1]